MLVKKYIYSDVREFTCALAHEARDFAVLNEKEASERLKRDDEAEKDRYLEAFERKCRELCEGGCGMLPTVPDEKEVSGEDGILVCGADCALVLKEMLSLCRKEANVQRLICIYNMSRSSENLKKEASRLRELSQGLLDLTIENDFDKKTTLALDLCERCDDASYVALDEIKSLMKAARSTVDMLIEKDVIEEYISCYEKIGRCALFSSIACRAKI